MTFDAIDAAFVHRWRTLTASARSPETALPGPPVAARPPAAPAAAAPATPPPSAPLSERLVAAAWPDWVALAGHVEEARLRGRRVTAIAGSRRGEGRTTLVECLAAVLRARGRDVVCTVPGDLAADGTTGAHDERLHDRRIILLDAGVWFPPGPLHRHRLAVDSVGVDAAILVRRHDQLGGTARRAALEALGVEVLGEVLTFTPTSSATELHDEERSE